MSADSKCGRNALLLAALVFLPAVMQPAALHAQASVVAFPTDAEGGKGNAEVDRALRSALQARSDVEVAPAPALDLEAMQLAIDCTGVNTPCLREVAERTNGEVLIAPTLERKSQTVELRILYFSTKDAVTRYAAHKEHGKRPTRETLDAIPGLLDELFASSKPAAEPAPAAAELPAPEPEPAADTAPTTIDDSATEPSEGKPLPVAPLIVAGGGGVLLGAGLVVGLLANKTEDDYADQPVTNAAQAATADDLRQRGKNQALIANVLLGLGAATIAAGGIWLLAASSSGNASQTAVLPDVGPDHAALQVSGRWGGL